MILPPWAYAAAAGVTFLAGFGSAWQVQQWRWHAHEASALKQAQAAFQAQLAKQNTEATHYETEKEAARVEYITREGQIRTVFKDRPVPADCAAPAAVRSVLSSAIGSANASAAQPGSEMQQPTGAADRLDRP